MGFFRRTKISVDEIVVNLIDAISSSATLTAGPLVDDLDRNEKKDQEKYTCIMTEGYCFYLHFVNRVGLSILGDPQRGQLMDRLATQLSESYVNGMWRDSSPKDKRSLLELVQSQINRAEDEYSKYQQITPEPNTGSKDTLIWEFAKKITAFSNHPHNPEIIRQVFVVTSNALARMPFQEIIKSYTHAAI